VVTEHLTRSWQPMSLHGFYSMQWQQGGCSPCRTSAFSFLLHSRALSSTVSAAFTRFDFPTCVQQSALLFYSYFLSVCTGNAEQIKKKNPKPPLQQTQGLTLFVKELKNYHVPEGPSPHTESRHFFKAEQPRRSTEIKRQPTCPARP